MNIKLLEASYLDYKFVYDIRNEEEVRDVCLNNEKIEIDKHIKWFEKNYKMYKIIVLNNEKVGFVRTDKDNEISIALKKEYRNMGIGQKVLKKLKGKAIIMLHNSRSLHCFIKSGWKLKGYYLEK